ncbi:MAG: chorismate mutase [Candidatus Bathyarchaeota archaeon]
MSYEEKIRPLRAEINRLNQEILDRILERVNVALQIGYAKRKHGKPVRDPARETVVLDQVARLAEARGLEPEAIRRVFREIIELCVAAEEAP